MQALQDFSMQRVKLYRLNGEGNWDDKGTGHVSVEFMEVLTSSFVQFKMQTGQRSAAGARHSDRAKESILSACARPRHRLYANDSLQL